MLIVRLTQPVSLVSPLSWTVTRMRLSHNYKQGLSVAENNLLICCPLGCGSIWRPILFACVPGCWVWEEGRLQRLVTHIWLIIAIYELELATCPTRPTTYNITTHENNLSWSSPPSSPHEHPDNPRVFVHYWCKHWIEIHQIFAFPLPPHVCIQAMINSRYERCEIWNWKLNNAPSEYGIWLIIIPYYTL